MLSDVNHRGVYERPVRPSEARAYTSASVCNLYTHLTKTSVAATNDVLEAGQNQTPTAAANTSTLTHSYRSSCYAVSCLKYAFIEQALGGAGGQTELNAYCILCKISTPSEREKSACGRKPRDAYENEGARAAGTD